MEEVFKWTVQEDAVLTTLSLGEYPELLEKACGTEVYANEKSVIKKTRHSGCFFNHLLVMRELRGRSILSPDIVYISKKEDYSYAVMPRGVTVTPSSISTIRMTKSFATKFFLEVLEGLVLLESRGYLHGDTKLNNIVLHKERYKLIDFGLLTRIGNNSSLRETHGNISHTFKKCGYALGNYDNQQQSFYAFFYTCSQAFGRVIPSLSTLTDYTITYDGSNYTEHCSQFQVMAHVDPKKLSMLLFDYEWAPIMEGFINGTYKSYSQVLAKMLCPFPNLSSRSSEDYVTSYRYLYEKIARNNLIVSKSTEVVSLFELFSSSNLPQNLKEIAKDCFYLVIGSYTKVKNIDLFSKISLEDFDQIGTPNIAAKLLFEYSFPGSWKLYPQGFPLPMAEVRRIIVTHPSEIITKFGVISYVNPEEQKTDFF